MKRTELIQKLTDLVPPDFDTLITTIPNASRYDKPSEARGARVAALLSWAESGTGPGLETVLFHAHDLFPTVFPDTRLTEDKKPPQQAFYVPYERNEFFTGREEVLRDMHHALQRQEQVAIKQAISGLGGVGKTQTALEYCYRYRDEYAVVLWATASSKEEVDRSLVAIARQLDLPEKDAQEQEVVVNASKHWLQTYSGWLLVLDNADDLAVLKSELPPNLPGRLLITTRETDLENWNLPEAVTLDTLSQEKAVEFLLKRTGRKKCTEAERNAAKELAQELGGLPLALEQAAAYIVATHRPTFASYLEGYRKRRLELLEKYPPKLGDYRLTVATTWEMNFEQIRSQSEGSVAILYICAFLAPAPIPESLFLPFADGDTLALGELLAPLTKYSLLRKSEQENAVEMHRLVQAVLRESLEGKAQAEWATMTVTVVNRASPDPDFANWPECEVLLPHQRVCSHYIAQLGIMTDQAALLLNKTGIYLYERGLYDEAEPLYLQVLEIWRNSLPEGHPSIATSLNNLAELYRTQGLYEKAEPLYLEALEMRRKSLPEGHPDIAASLNNLALLYSSQDLYEQAEPLHLQALEIVRKSLPEGHPNIATSLNNLAGLYQSQGLYEQAELLHREAMEIVVKALGPQHPRTQKIFTNYLILLVQMGRDAQVEAMAPGAAAQIRAWLARQEATKGGH